jgi:hypothetical protein
MHPREKRIAELQAMIESAKAEIKAIQAEAQIEKAEDARVDNEEGSLQERNTADAVAAYEADRGLSGNRNEQGDLVTEKQIAEPDEAGLKVKIKGNTAQMEDVIEGDQRTDEESAKRKFAGIEQATDYYGGNTELDGGRTFAEEDKSVERTMGFQTSEGGIMSVDEKDDYWKTQEGYDKALEMYGRKPAFVKEPTLQWNPKEQKYEKIEEEEFEDLSSPAMSADVKALFG